MSNSDQQDRFLSANRNVVASFLGLTKELETLDAKLNKLKGSTDSNEVAKQAIKACKKLEKVLISHCNVLETEQNAIEEGTKVLVGKAIAALTVRAYLETDTDESTSLKESLLEYQKTMKGLSDGIRATCRALGQSPVKKKVVVSLGKMEKFCDLIDSLLDFIDAQVKEAENGSADDLEEDAA